MRRDGTRVSSILVRAALTIYHGPGGLNNKHLFLTVLEAEKLKIEAPAGKMSGVW